MVVSNIKPTASRLLLSPPLLITPQALLTRRHRHYRYFKDILLPRYLGFCSNSNTTTTTTTTSTSYTSGKINSGPNYQRTNSHSYIYPSCNNIIAKASSISFTNTYFLSPVRCYGTSSNGTSSPTNNNEKNSTSSHPTPQGSDNMTQYSKTLHENGFKPLDKKGGVYDLSQHKGDVIVVVNVASKCGFTPQYEGLEKLYKTYKDQGLTILGFPSNEFGKQEPGTAEEIESFCQLNYGVTFPVLAKTHVNGDNAEDIYKWLKSEQKGLLTNGIKWNFTKFIIDREGNVVSRWSPTTKPESMEDAIKAELAKPKPEAKI